jgi:aspartate/glutamate racemase
MFPKRGYSTYGEDIGVLMLDTRFPRPIGDIGNANTFQFPVKYKIVKSATPEKIVAARDVARATLPLFIEAAQELESEGVRAIVTSCGFLTVVQDELASSVNVPVVTSSLMLVPLVSRMIGASRKVGILTANAQTLSKAHLEAVGIDDTIDVVISGMERSQAFHSMIFQDLPNPDFKQIERDVYQACAAMKENEPSIGAFVFECTNLQPYAERIQTELRMPVFGIIQVVNLLQTSCSDHWL